VAEVFAKSLLQRPPVGKALEGYKPCSDGVLQALWSEQHETAAGENRERVLDFFDKVCLEADNDIGVHVQQNPGQSQRSSGTVELIRLFATAGFTPIWAHTVGNADQQLALVRHYTSTLKFQSQKPL
jgi:GH25 family lysozyme M1 (1,4-beta-N-acetylmuramidase)